MELEGFERIVLKFIENRIPQAKAFSGRWIIFLDKPYIENADYYAVAVTPKNNIVIFNFWNGPDDDLLSGHLSVFSSLEEASSQQGLPAFLVTEIMKRQGVEVQELDI